MPASKRDIKFLNRIAARYNIALPDYVRDHANFTYEYHDLIYYAICKNIQKVSKSEYAKAFNSHREEFVEINPLTVEEILSNKPGIIELIVIDSNDEFPDDFDSNCDKSYDFIY